MDDLDDQLLDQEEMNDMFSRPIGQDVSMSDADLESGTNCTSPLPAHRLILSQNWLDSLRPNSTWARAPCTTICTHPVYLFTHSTVVMQQRQQIK